MNLGYWATAGFRALTTGKSGPSLYDLCDPLLRGSGPGDPHLRKFYNAALANPPLRLLLSRAGLPELRDEGRAQEVRNAILAARDQATPDWAAIGGPLATLLDGYPQSHPRPGKQPARAGPPAPVRIERMISACARHLIGSFRRNGFVPGYAAFNLAGDPDFRGRDLVLALRELNARTYKNATLLFNLARIFILANPHVSALIVPPFGGVAAPLWEPVQIRHRSAYYDAFFAESLIDFLDSGLAAPGEAAAARRLIAAMVEFCATTSREDVPGFSAGRPFAVVTALAPAPHARLNRFFRHSKSDLGFGSYVPDCDTTACALSAISRFAPDHAILDQPMLDFYADYQIGTASGRHGATVAINDNIDFNGGVATWIENAAGERPFGNDLDPTLNLDVLEAAFRNYGRWRIAEDSRRIALLRRIVSFQAELVHSGQFANPRSHVYYLPELYCAYFGRCHAAFRAMPEEIRAAVDPGHELAAMAPHVLAYVRDLIRAEINPFDAALALLALAKLGAEPSAFAPALSCLAERFGEGGRSAPFKGYEWNKMKTPTRIIVGGPEVTSAFVLSALVHARAASLRPEGR